MMKVAPFRTALQMTAAKTPLPTNLSSAELKEIDSDILERALFSSRVTNARFLQGVRDVIKGVFSAKMTEEEGRAKLQKLLTKLKYKPDAGGMQDLSSDARINLIISTNIAQAAGYARWKSGQNKAVLYAWPAQEFYRAQEREEPRNWPERWAAAGGTFYEGSSDYPEGRMIAKKNDPIWTAISAFGTPYAPFDYNSGMDLRDISRQEAVELGVIGQTDKIEPEDRSFDTEADVEGLDTDFQNELLEAAGDDYEIVDGVLTKLENRNHIGEGNEMVILNTHVKEYVRHSTKGGIYIVHEHDRKGGKTKRIISAEDAKGVEGAKQVGEGRWARVKRVGGMMKFIKGKGMALVGSKPALESGEKWPSHVPPAKVAPAWKDAWVNLDPKSKLIAKGVDEAGRVQPLYSDAHFEETDAEKFGRVEDLVKQHDDVGSKLMELSTSKPKKGGGIAYTKNVKETSDSLLLMHSMGLRPGGDKDTGASTQAYGASTLEGRHVYTDSKGKVWLKFTGKSGKNLKLPVSEGAWRDEVPKAQADYIESMLVSRAKKAGSTGRLFETSGNNMSDVMAHVSDGKFKSKDLRTALAAKLAKREVEDLDFESEVKRIKDEGATHPEVVKAFQMYKNHIGDHVSEVLGNTRAVALKKYIPPSVFDGWRKAAGLKKGEEK